MSPNLYGNTAQTSPQTDRLPSTAGVGSLGTSATVIGKVNTKQDGDLQLGYYFIQSVRVNGETFMG